MRGIVVAKTPQIGIEMTLQTGTLTHSAIRFKAKEARSALLNRAKFRVLLAMTVVAVAYGSSLTAATKAKDLRIGVLKNISPVGCGCYVSPAGLRERAYDKYIFISDATDKAYINIDGRDTEL